MGATIAPPTLRRIAHQQNGYDYGVFVVDGTRALVTKLATGQPDLLGLHKLSISRPCKIG